MRNFLVPAFVLTLIFTQKLNAMSFLNFGKTCVFSEVCLHILQNGRPVSNALVTRQWNWNKRGQDKSETDVDGYVFFRRFMNHHYQGCFR